MMTRRDFLKNTALGSPGMALPLAAFEIIDPEKLMAQEASENTKVRWVFLVDTYKCVGCGFCVKACKNENEIPYDANVTRTWVERYVLTKDGRALRRHPKGARDGFTTTKIDLGPGKYQEIKKEDIDKAFFVPKLCNQCENPPCVQVCPVGATYPDRRRRRARRPDLVHRLRLLHHGAAPTASGSSTRCTTPPRNATSATTASPRA